MKAILLGLGLNLLLSGAALANQNGYSFISVPHEDVDAHLVPGSDKSETPDSLQGLWWMDGNPLPDEVVSMAGAKFTPVLEDGRVVGHEAYLPVYDEGVWTWHDSKEGEALYSAVRKFRLVYHIVFNTDFTEGTVYPTLEKWPTNKVVEIPASMLLSFTMKQVSPDEYSRDSVILGQPSQYRFRRIVDSQGRRLPVYQEYVASIKARGLTNALLPVCRDPHLKSDLPTVCASR